MKTKPQNLKARYERLETDRYTFLDRARSCAELTIPTLVPPLGHNATTKYYTPWQGVGARGVNNLASKLLLSLLPPNSPFFRLQVDDFTLQKIAGTDEARAQVEEALSKVERAINDEIEGTGMRSQIFLALKHLIVAGNVLVYMPKEGGMRVFCLDSYVVIRDPKGNLLDIIIKECINAEQLGEEAIMKIVEAQKDKINDERDESYDPDDDDEIEVYTRFYRDGKTWRMYQEVDGHRVEGSEGSWPIDKAPMLALRWTPVHNEDYGRSYVEEYLGDMIGLEALSKAIVEASAQVAKIVWLVSPNGVTRASDITKAESGDAVTGHENDVHCLQADKQADMKIASEAVKTISDRLAHAFLLNSSVQRNGERVTAEEIRFMAGELEDALGGVYSVFTQEFQLPVVHRQMDRMTKAKRLPDLPKNVVKPMIITGLEALGRGHDLSKYQMFFQVLQPLGPQVMSYINLGDAIKRLGTSLMIDMGGLVKTEQEVQQATQQAQQQAQGQQMADIAGKAAPAAIKAASDHMMASRAGTPPANVAPDGGNAAPNGQ